ncbi:hypothetical protein CABS03_00777 [Colletotrichum abscissum]|uniref:Uncharacterized protein n=1 Tax=Colletotrichum abscissum TaxID=1671311 RepID=A0A9P9XMD6_9PEZI|nr:hypothetical protein CABS02_03499 [Colletotrichum abscissum]
MLGTPTGSKFRRFKGHPRRDGSKLAIDDDRRSLEDTEGSAAWNRLRAATRILYYWWRPTTARRRTTPGWPSNHFRILNNFELGPRLRCIICCSIETNYSVRRRSLEAAHDFGRTTIRPIHPSQRTYTSIWQIAAWFQRAFFATETPRGPKKQNEVLRQAAATCLFGSGNAGLNKDPRSRSGKEPVTADSRDGRRAEKARGWRHDAKFHAQKDSDLQATSIFSFSVL